MNHLEPDLAQLHGLTPSEFARLPLCTRVVDRLTAVLVLTDEVLADLGTEDADPILWLEPEIRRVFDEVDSAIQRLAQ